MVPARKWIHLLGSSEWDSGRAITTADDGSIYITGSTWGDFDGQTNSGDCDVFITKFNSDGPKQWTQLLGSSSYDDGYSITTADDGSIYITGSTSGDLDGQTNSGVDDVFITKFNSDGSKRWTQLLGSSSYDYGNSITTADDGSIYITGSTNGNFDGQTNSGDSDVFITKFSSDGSKQWTQLLGSSDWDSAYSITTADDGSIYITGSTYGDLDGQTNSGGSDVFITKFNTDGSQQWTQLLGGWDDDNATSITTADDGSIYIAGHTWGDFDEQTNSGTRDVFISKFGLNDSPVGLASSTSTFDEGIAGGSVVATLRTSDVDAGETFTYALVNGEGGADNSAFAIDGDQLKIVDSVDFENKSSYSIRVQAKDSGGLTFQKVFTFSVNDLEEVPVIQSLEDASTHKKITTYKIEKPIVFSGQDIDTVIVGTKKKDKITGTLEGEVLAGIKGKNVLEGGEGADGFLFNQIDGFGNKHADKIKDFDSDEGDSILVDQDIFSLGKKIKLKVLTGNSKAKKAAKSKKDFVYAEKKGLLYFNENGKQNGWGDGGLFAKLQGAPELGADDFTIV